MSARPALLRLLLAFCLSAAAAFAQGSAASEGGRPKHEGGGQLPRSTGGADSAEAGSSPGDPSGSPQPPAPEAAADTQGTGGEQAESSATKEPAAEGEATASASVAAGEVSPGGTEEAPEFRKYTWDPRSGYGLCDRVCAQGEACVDGRCVLRCSPECRDGTYCTPSGECLPLPSPQSDIPTEAELQTRLGKPSASARQAFFIDLAGILFRGATLNLEFGRKHAVRARFSPMNTGLTNYFEEPATEFERFEWGIGGALGYRHYEARFGNLRGFYYGGGAGYEATEVRDLTSGQYALNTHYVRVFGEFGYRWSFGHFLFGFGPVLSIRQSVFEARRGLSDDSCVFWANCRDRTGDTLFEGVMSLEVGWFPETSDDDF